MAVLKPYQTFREEKDYDAEMGGLLLCFEEFSKMNIPSSSPIRHQRQTMQNLAIIAIADNKRSPS